MPNVLMFKGESQYDALRNYIDEVEMGFRLAGYNTHVLDRLEDSFGIQYSELIHSIKIDITFSFNAILQRILDQTCYITYLTDHPAIHKQRLEVLDARAIVFVCDKRHEQFIHQYCPNIKYVKYIPLSGTAWEQYIPYDKRTKDIVFTGTYVRPEVYLRNALHYNKEPHGMAKYMAESIIAHPEQDLEMCLQNGLSFYDIEVPDDRFCDWMSEFIGIDRYARSYYRDKMIRSLVENGLQIHVFGNGWENFEGEGKENLIIETGNFYFARKAVADSKISLNIMPWFKDGFQERIAAAMLSGTVAVTDDSKYINENFRDGKELVLYSLHHLEELPVKVKWLLEHQDDAERIALAGKVCAEQGMTWQHRVFEMIRYMQECILCLSPKRGTYGEILQIPYSDLHKGKIASDTVKNVNAVIDMVSQIVSQDKMELCDIKYYYTKILFQFLRINPSFPEVNISDFIYNYINHATEAHINEAVELLMLECTHLLAMLLTVVNQELKFEINGLRNEINGLRNETNRLCERLEWANKKPNAHAQDMIIKKLKMKYGESDDKDIQEILENIERNHFVQAYNQNFANNYFKVDEELERVQYDPEAEMHFAFWNGKKMYYPKEFSKENVAENMNFIKKEQDLHSPHRYLEERFDVEDGDIVVDAGVAEGNFALDVVERAQKVYLVECDHKWIEALQKTFEPWKEKVVIVEKMLGDANDKTYASLDRIVEEGHINFLKLDVEGAEIASLKGASKILSMSRNVKCAVCAYHRKNAEKDIREFLEEHHFYTSVTKGYMFFGEDLDSWVDGELRHGIVRAVKY